MARQQISIIDAGLLVSTKLAEIVYRRPSLVGIRRTVDGGLVRY